MLFMYCGCVVPFIYCELCSAVYVLWRVVLFMYSGCVVLFMYCGCVVLFIYCELCTAVYVLRVVKCCLCNVSCVMLFMYCVFVCLFSVFCHTNNFSVIW